MQASHFGFRIAEVPARTRYFDDASSISLRRRDRLRPEDAVGGRAARAAPARTAALAQVPAVTVTGERVIDPRRRLQPDLAAPRRRLRAVRAAAAGRAACSTSAAASATRFSVLAPRETVGVDLDAEALERPGPRDRRRRHARAPVRRTAASPRCCRCSRSSTCPTPSACWREVTRVLEPGGRRHLRDAQPPHVRPPRRDHRSVPLRRVHLRGAAGRLRAVLRGRRDARLVRLRPAISSSSPRSGTSSTCCCARTRCGCGERFRARVSKRLYDWRLSRERKGRTTPGRGRSPSTTSSCVPRDSTMRSTWWPSAVRPGVSVAFWLRTVAEDLDAPAAEPRSLRRQAASGDRLLRDRRLRDKPARS